MRRRRRDGRPRVLARGMIAAALLAAALLAGCGGSGGGGGAGVAAHATVTINAVEQYQRIAGFGVSEGFGQAETLMNAPASIQHQVLSLLYSPTRGAGLTILRNEISADAGFTIEPTPPGSPNAKPSYLTLAEVGQDQGQLWFAKQIKARYGDSMIMSPAQTANFMAILGATLARSGLSTHAECCASVGWNYAQQFAAAIETDKAATRLRRCSPATATS